MTITSILYLNLNILGTLRHMAAISSPQLLITDVKLFELVPDTSKVGRILSSAKIGDVYMSRLVIEPRVVTGNYYHYSTSIMFYVEYGSVVAGFEQIKTKEHKIMNLKPGRHVIHVSPLVALATKNIGFDKAVVIFFSNHELRSDDTCDYKIF